jgi:hypothetical protein
MGRAQLSAAVARGCTALCTLIRQHKVVVVVLKVPRPSLCKGLHLAALPRSSSKAASARQWQQPLLQALRQHLQLGKRTHHSSNSSQ